MAVENIGIRELRQNASRIIEAAVGGATYRVTNHGKDTGVLISVDRPDVERERPAGATPDQIINSGVYENPKPAGYEREMLRMVERGRNQSGFVGE